MRTQPCVDGLSGSASSRVEQFRPGLSSGECGESHIAAKRDTERLTSAV